MLACSWHFWPWYFWPLAFETDSRVYEYETEEAEYFHLRILAVNDFHGHIATSSSAFGGVGRADYLAASIASAA